MTNGTRAALLTTAFTGAILAVSAPAQAACVVTGASIVCGNTTTSNTGYSSNVPNDRGYPPGVWTDLTVSSGALVDNFGLAIGTFAPGLLTVTNNGTIRVNAGNTPAVSPSGAAMYIDFYDAAGSGLYQGPGNIENLGNGNGLEIQNFSTTGTSTANVGGNVRADNGTAILLNSGSSGLSTVTTTAGRTIAAINGDGIDVSSTGTGAILINSAAAVSSTTGIGIDASATTGAVNVTTGAGAVSGLSDGIEASTTTGNITIVTGAGAVSGSAPTGRGIDATASGASTVSVTTGAGLVSGGFDGIVGSTNGGVLNVTVGAGGATGGSFGIQAVSLGATPGTQTVIVNGTVTGTTNSGVRALSDGARVINIGTAGIVTGATQSIELVNNGATTITNLGRIGAAATGLAVLGPATGAVTLTNGSASNSAAILNGRLTLGAGADSLTNRAVFNTQGTTDFGAGADTLANLTGGVINILGNTTFANLETFTQTGRINFSAATTLTGPAIAFVNGPGSFIDTAGAATIAGFTSLTNSGTIDLAAGTFTVPAGVLTNTATGIVIADEGATTITGQTSFANNGTIDLSDGAIGDTLTVNSNYVGGNGSRLQVDVSGTTADTLVIVGAPTGQTLIDVNTVGLGVFDPDGILVVDATGASSGAFAIGEEIANPLINFDVAQIGNDYFLVTLLDPETAFVPLAATGLVREMWYQSADEVFAHTLAPTAKLGLSVWAQAYGSQRRTGMTNNQVVNGVQYDADNNIEIDRYGFQGGVGYGFGVAEVGLTGGYANAQANGDGEFNADGWNIGLYGRYGALTGFHAEALFKHDSYDMSFDGLFDGNDGDASSTGVDGSIGYRLPVGVVPSIDIYAGLSHVWSDMDGVSAFGFDYDFDDMTSTRGRLGVRGNFGGLYNPYLSGAVYHEFSGDGDVTITQGAFSDSLSSTGKGTWARLEGGLAGGKGTYGMNVAGWVDLGDTRGAGIRAGIRF
ncbi:beta strand repeat-containing protein [Sphingomonas mesophila]|uniref:beta strand repeat-containing protein n=1 Tax=Sphingomonas mesophila TaxID=2303576 RepID=UPI000E56AD24|nr:autotransporter outer membrane beta-barrel domain-containing protein [Sphingomonas mesophila]